MAISRRQILFGLGGLGILASLKLQTAAQGSGWQFVSIADTGTGEAGQYAVADAMNKYYKVNPFGMVLLAGDNIYNFGEIQKIRQVFEQPYAELLDQGVKFHAALGNHDVATNNGLDEVDYKPFGMSGSYYSFQENQAQFFAINTNIDNTWAKQLQWLDQSLAESKATWKIVFGHHPVYSSGIHGNTQTLVESLPAIFAKHKVALYLCGHDHNYERSKVLDGTTYIVHGAGSSIRPVFKSDFTAFSTADLSFVSVEVSTKQLEIKAINTDGKIFDSVTINQV